MEDLRQGLRTVFLEVHPLLVTHCNRQKPRQFFGKLRLIAMLNHFIIDSYFTFGPLCFTFTMKFIR